MLMIRLNMTHSRVLTRVHTLTLWALISDDDGAQRVVIVMVRDVVLFECLIRTENEQYDQHVDNTSFAELPESTLACRSFAGEFAPI
eukprot:4751728-Pyramimonas_sp.AAC.1